MTTNSPFGINADYEKMSADIVKRSFDLKIKTASYTAAGAVAGIAAGAALGAAVPDAAFPGILYGGMAGAYGGGVASAFLLSQEKDRLELDREFAHAQAHGNRNWANYRQEVMEHGAPVAGGHGLPVKATAKAMSV